MGMTEIEKKALKRSGGAAVFVACAPAQTEPLAVTLKESTRLSGFSRSKLYLLAGAGRLVFLKNDSRVLVDYQSLKAAVAELPRAMIARA